MPHVTTIDPKENLFTVAINGLWTEEDAKTLDVELKQMLPATGKRQAVIDMDKGIRYEGTEARRLTAKTLVEHNISHLAVYNARPAVRILVKILLQMVSEGTTQARFFATRDEALAWLREEREGK